MAHQPGKFHRRRRSLRQQPPNGTWRKIEDQEIDLLRGEAVQFKTVVQDLIEVPLQDPDPLGISASDSPAIASWRANAVQIREQIDSVKSAADFTNDQYQTRRTFKNRMTNGTEEKIRDPAEIEELQSLKNRCFSADRELNRKTATAERVIVETTQKINTMNANLGTERSRFQRMYDERKKEYEVAKRKRKNEERLVREKLLQIQSLRRQEMQAARSINGLVETLDRYEPAFDNVNELRRKHANLSAVLKKSTQFSACSITTEQLEQDWRNYFNQFCSQWRKWDERYVIVWMKIVFGEEVITPNVQENIVKQGIRGKYLQKITTADLYLLGIQKMEFRQDIVQQIQALNFC